MFAVVGGILNGAFAVFLKQKNPWRWENFWLVYSIIALVVFPLIWISIAIPGLGAIAAHMSFGMLVVPMLFGALWGIGSILFGLAVDRIGMALTFTIVVGLATAIGSLAPLFFNEPINQSTLSILLFGIVVTVVGIIVSGYAGFCREKILGADRQASAPRLFKSGLLMAIISGMISPMSNIGFAYAKNIAAFTPSSGAPSWSAPLVALEVVLLGGFFINAGYALYLLFRNRSFVLFRQSKLRPVSASIAAGIFWFGGIGLYAIATAYLGILGTSVGYAVNLSTGIISTNILGVITGEWKNSWRALKIQLTSILILVVGMIVISFSLFVR